MSTLSAQEDSPKVWFRPMFDPWPYLLFALLLLIPLTAHLGSESFVLSLLTRAVILSIAALALDLLIGFAGLVSLGHAGFLGIGTYSVGILQANGVTDGVVALCVAMTAAAAFGLVTGAIAIRSKGGYFIMITLAFGQMLYFIATALAQYGGDDGMTLAARSELFGSRALENDWIMYYASVIVLALIYVLLRRVVGSRFGRVLTGTRENELRVRSIGFKPYPVQLIAYVMAGVLTAVAGVLLANQAGFVNPATMTWQRSADLIFMVVLGGSARLYGAIVGAIFYVVAQEFLSHWTEHWPLLFGPLLIAVVFLAKRGIVGLIARSEPHR